MTPWPSQTYGVEATEAAIERGERRICLTSPTGGGKGWIIEELGRRNVARGLPVALFTNRKLLTEQQSGRLLDRGIYHGIRQSGYDEEYDPQALFQLCGVHTEHSRVNRKKTWSLHAACPGGLAIFDEGHLHTGPTSCGFLDQYRQAGASTVLVTATPIGMAEVADTLICAGTTSELRACGALVLAHHFGPDEPDLKALKTLHEGEDLSEPQLRKVMPAPSLWGRVWEWFEKLNPEHKPTILFASGVEESIWFAEQFTAKGVRAAHIDGNDIWVDGEFHRSGREVRQEVLDDSRDGRVAVLCNRFVLREGIDCPWLAHGIFATVFGSLQSYLQSGGRLLRAHHSLDCVTLQDHGGNWWRHGSLNADRTWHLDDTANSVYALRADRLRQKKDREPMRCPQCARVLTAGHCPNCGLDCRKVKKSRPVVSTDGTLKELSGDVFRMRRIDRSPDGPRLWERMYHRSRTEKGSRTFRAAAALFAQENHWGWPDPAWPLMPTDEHDWFRLVADVPRDKLT